MTTHRTPYSRRTWMAALGGLTASLALPSRARAGAKKLLIVGSSTIEGGFGIWLAQALEERDGYEVERRAHVSSGLARPDFYDWVAAGAKAHEQFGPDATVVMFGGNDGQGLYMGKQADPKWHRYGEPGWTPEYRKRVNDFSDAVAPNGEWIFWIGMPQVESPKLNARIRHMNKIYRAEMAVRRHALFIDTWRELVDDEGEFTSHLAVDGKRTRVRAADGIHLSRTGAHMLVDVVQPQIAAVLGGVNSD